MQCRLSGHRASFRRCRWHFRLATSPAWLAEAFGCTSSSWVACLACLVFKFPHAVINQRLSLNYKTAASVAAAHAAIRDRLAAKLILSLLRSPIHCNQKYCKCGWLCMCKPYTLVVKPAFTAIALYAGLLPCTILETDSALCRYMQQSAETCNPWHMEGVGPWYPVGWDTVIQTKSIEANLKSTEMQSSVCLCVAGRRFLTDEQQRQAVATSFHKNSLRQLKHKMCRCLTRLVGQTWQALLIQLVPRHIHSQV